MPSISKGFRTKPSGSSTWTASHSVRNWESCLPSEKADGSAHYTHPAIHDPSTGAYISDSILITEYLEKMYPETPHIFPNNTLALQATFIAAF
jgi:hypothetical protein